MPALPYGEVAERIAKVRDSARAGESSKLALEFLVLTTARSGEVRKATWDEIDLDGATWTVPAERMKTNREHRVPRSKRALEVLKALTYPPNRGRSTPFHIGLCYPYPAFPNWAQGARWNNSTWRLANSLASLAWRRWR